MSRIYVGTSGFNYKHWSEGVFYPDGLPQAKWLPYYSQKFSTIELNVSFYRLPELSSFEKWRSDTPAGFCFSIKGSRYITHVKKLNNAFDSLKLFNEHILGLEEKAGVVLWQLPFNFKKDKDRLFSFCREISLSGLGRLKHAFEFRNESWFEEDVYKILRAHNFALVIADSKKWPKAEILTADFLYLRFHGGVLYTSNYTGNELRKWADKTKRWMKGRDVFAYFNNDAMGYAPKNAQTFRQLLST